MRTTIFFYTACDNLRQERPSTLSSAYPILGGLGVVRESPIVITHRIMSVRLSMFPACRALMFLLLSSLLVITRSMIGVWLRFDDGRGRRAPSLWPLASTSQLYH